MSGQAVTLPLAEASVAFAGTALERHEVGILDMRCFPDALTEVGGFLSLAFFEQQPLSVDYTRRVVAFGSAEGVSVPVTVERDGPSVTVFMPLPILCSRSMLLLVGMCSQTLIL